MEDTGASVSEPRGDPTAQCPTLSSAAHTLLGGMLLSHCMGLHFSKNKESQALYKFSLSLKLMKSTAKNKTKQKKPSPLVIKHGKEYNLTL